MKIETLLIRKDMTFKEAAQYFCKRVPVTADKFYALTEEYQGLAFTASGYTKPKNSETLL